MQIKKTSRVSASKTKPGAYALAGWGPHSLAFWSPQTPKSQNKEAKKRAPDTFDATKAIPSDRKPRRTKWRRSATMNRFDDRYAEPGGLAGAGLWLPHDVEAVAERLPIPANGSHHSPLGRQHRCTSKDVASGKVRISDG